MFEPQVPERDLLGYPKYWAHEFGSAPFLPMNRREMDALGWDSCDIILVTGDAYVDHPSFGMALVGRLLESNGFRVGIISQPDWHSADAFAALGKPNVMFGITAGNMDSMVNRYTSDRKVRNDDAYTPDGDAGSRPDRSILVYANRCREAFSGVPIVIGGIEASLRRIAHYDYWSDKVRRSALVDAKADLLVFGNGERAIVEIAHRLARGDEPHSIRDVRGTAFMSKATPEAFDEVESTTIDRIGHESPRPNPYQVADEASCATEVKAEQPTERPTLIQLRRRARERQVIRLPSFETVAKDYLLYAHASRVLHLETNPHNARPLLQRHGDRDVWINPPPLPLTTPEMDAVYELPYARVPHPSYGDRKIPAYEMIRFSVTIMRGCFGGCSFCSITEHEGRIIQNRSEKSVLDEIEKVRDKTPGFTGVISDVGGPTANMYRLACKSRAIEAACRKPSCVFPDVCPNLKTDHKHLIALYRKARSLPGIKKVLVASGLRYDLAVKSPEYVSELAKHHVGGYLKIAPEHTEDGPLGKMMKPGIGAYDRFKELFDRASKKAGKKQYLIPYFIAAHPGTTDEDMLALALWLKKNRFRADQVQAFLPAPMASATTMYHTELNPLRSLASRERVAIPKRHKVRALHKAFLRYHDPNNWPVLRAALKLMGRADLIGEGPGKLISHRQPVGSGPKGKRMLTQHTGLPPTPHTPRRNRKKRGP